MFGDEENVVAKGKVGYVRFNINIIFFKLNDINGQWMNDGNISVYDNILDFLNIFITKMNQSIHPKVFDKDGKNWSKKYIKVVFPMLRGNKTMYVGTQMNWFKTWFRDVKSWRRLIK